MLIIKYVTCKIVIVNLKISVMKYYFTCNLFQSWYLQDYKKVVRIVEQQAQKLSQTTLKISLCLQVLTQTKTKIEIKVRVTIFFFIFVY